MSEENASVTEPEDDATIVHDEAAEETAHDKLVADVTKMLDETPAEAKPDEKEPPKEPKGDEPANAAEAESAEMSDELQARAEGAGISKELAQTLHQTGHLEETLAAFDRTLIKRFSTKAEDQPKEAEEAKGKAPKEPPPEAKGQEELLDPEVYDEGLVKRDAYHKRRIDALEAQVAELFQERHAAFDKRVDGMIDGLDHEDLFGKGGLAPKDKQANRDKLFKAYQGVCLAYDVDANDCDPQWAKRALAAMFPEEVFKKAQRQTVDRLRDAEGKFLSPSKTKGAPPAKGATEEEVHGQLVSDVTAYLKKQGVQMSGV